MTSFEHAAYGSQ